MPAPPIASTSLFVYFGAVTAGWAVLVSFIGLSRVDFPTKDSGGERIVIGISVLLVAASIGTAIGTAQQGKHANEAQAAPAQKPSAQPAPAAPAPTPTAATKLALTADPTGQLRFNTTTLQAKAGKVQIVLSNPAPLGHNISLQGPGVNGHGPTVPQGGTSTVTATLKPGSYTFYCSVPGHRQAGMQGTLTVR